MGRPAGSKNKEKVAPERITLPVADFSVILKVNGEEHVGKGPTLLDALDDLPRVVAKTKGVLTVTKDGKVGKSIIYAIPMLNRLFYPGMTGVIQRAVFAKRYSYAA